MADEKKLSNEQLDEVAGGMGNINLGGNYVGGNQNFVDQTMIDASTTVKTYDDHSKNTFIDDKSTNLQDNSVNVLQQQDNSVNTDLL